MWDEMLNCEYYTVALFSFVETCGVYVNARIVV